MQGGRRWSSRLEPEVAIQDLRRDRCRRQHRPSRPTARVGPTSSIITDDEPPDAVYIGRPNATPRRRGARWTVFIDDTTGTVGDVISIEVAATATRIEPLERAAHRRQAGGARSA